jgi:glutamate dehydrogenase/leucine dehydrogenase
MDFEHEQVVVRRGDRTGLTIIVAIYSTARGPALGGCRLWRYPDWRDGLTDALRLSAGMTDKCAVAGIPYGGGKTVVVAGDGPVDRQAAMHDVGDLIESLGGRYATGPDAGTGPADMDLIGERTRHVFCRTAGRGGSGDSSPATAVGVLAAIRAVCAGLFGSADLAGRRAAVVGLGHVGGILAGELAKSGAQVVAADIDPAKRALAGELGATWLTPEEALTAPVDVLVPAALGGVLTAAVVPRLRCAAVVGPANNQLADESVADLLHERGIVWAPDYAVSGGGIIYATASELEGLPPGQALARVRGIGETVGRILAAARRDRTAPHRAARRLARGVPAL